MTRSGVAEYTAGRPDGVFESLSESVKTIRSLFGEHVDRILRTDQRRSKASPFGGTRHRLGVLIDLAEKTLATRSDPVPVASMPAVVELGIAALLFEQWKHHPLWDEFILTGLRDATSYPHALHVLICAYQFPEQRVTLQTSLNKERSSDLIVTFDDKYELAIEVKTPQKLQRIQPNLNDEHSQKEILRLIRKANDKEGGQLSPDRSALLAIGGFHLGRTELDNLRKGCEYYFHAKGSRRRHLCGIMIMTIGALFENMVLDADGTLRSQEGSRLRSFSRAQLSKNPHYTGPISLDFFSRTEPDLETAVEIRRPPR